MLWLELTKNPLHGGAGWEFGRCLWSPGTKENGANWPFWSGLLQVKKKDPVVHLRYDKKDWNFVGTSAASSDGFTTTDRPPQPDESGFATRFNRVELENYQAFSTPIPLKTIFRDKDLALRGYFSTNSSLSKSQRKHIFFVIQAGRLQCLNGAYLTEVDEALAAILFGSDYSGQSEDKKISTVDVPTANTLRMIKARVGQAEFSSEVRKNFGYKCCFPECSVSDEKFLVGAHIARWADAVELRGNISNGLCLCLMHDKAFEMGLFTLSDDLEICVAKAATNSNWATNHLVPFDGMSIKCGIQQPSTEALQRHRLRHNFSI